MKKLVLLTAFLLIFGLAFGMADELTLSGSVSWEFGDDDIAEDPGLDFGSASSGAVGTLSLSVAGDNVEAGVTINLLPAITLTDGEDAMPGDIQDFVYDAIQAALDWYYYQMVLEAANFTQDNGLNTMAAPLVPADVWSAAAMNGVLAVADVNSLVTGAGPWTVGDNPEDLTKLEDTRDLHTAVIGQVVVGIGKLSASYKSSDADLAGVDYIDATWDLDVIAAAEDEKDLYDDAYEHVFGEDTDDSWANSFPVTAAYLKVKNVFNVLDFTAEIGGKAVGVGSMVTSDATAGNDANVGLSVGLSEGVVEGLSASVLVTASDDGAAEVTQNWESLAKDDEAAEPAVWGLQIDAGFDAGMVAFGVGFGIADLSEDEAAEWIAGVDVSLSLPDVAGLSAGVEFNLNGGADLGMGAGVSVGAGIMGISPTVSFYWKDDNFGDDDTSNAATGADDITDDAGLMAEFDSTVVSSTALGVDLAVDLAELMGMSLITLGGGLDLMLAPSSNMGWDANVGLALADVIDMPITLGFSMSKWAEEDLVWAAVLGYTYDILSVSFTFEQTEADVIGWKLAGSVTL